MKSNRIPVAKPRLNGNEKKYVLDCLETGWISSHGKYIAAFEEEFAAFCGVKHAVATNNGTTALHLALVALGVGPGDEVIVPTVTYIATANAVRYCGATPILVDVCPETLLIDPLEIEKKITPKTKGIIPVHLYGHPANMGELQAIASKNNKLFILEDAAEAHGAEYQGTKVGGLGDCATFSFFGNKIITTGEGGMVTTNDDKLAEKLRLYRGQGMDLKRRYWFPVIGYNYRMTNIQAALGLAQLEVIEHSLADRLQVASWYEELLEPLSDYILLPQKNEWATKHVYWMYNIFLRAEDEKYRDKVMRLLDEADIETRPVFYPLHQLPPYQENLKYCIADNWAQRGINLPTHQDLTKAEIKRIAETLTQILCSQSMINV